MTAWDLRNNILHMQYRRSFFLGVFHSYWLKWSNENLDNHIGKSVERNFSRSFQRSARGVRNAISVAKGIFDQQWSRIDANSRCFSKLQSLIAWSMTIIKRVLKGYTLIENWLKIPNWFSSPLLWTSHIIFLGSRWGLSINFKTRSWTLWNSVGKQNLSNMEQ